MTALSLILVPNEHLRLGVIEERPIWGRQTNYLDV